MTWWWSRVQIIAFFFFLSWFWDTEYECEDEQNKLVFLFLMKTNIIYARVGVTCKMLTYVIKNVYINFKYINWNNKIMSLLNFPNKFDKVIILFLIKLYLKCFKYYYLFYVYIYIYIYIIYINIYIYPYLYLYNN